MKESSDGETLMAVSIWFQIWGAAVEKARRPKSVFVPGMCRRDWYNTLEERRELLSDWIDVSLYKVIKVSTLLSGDWRGLCRLGWCL